MKKSLLWIIVMILSISMVVVFSFAGCKKEAAPAEEEEVEEVTPTEEEAAEEAPAAEETYPSDWFEVTKELPKLYAGTTLKILSSLGPISDRWDELAQQFMDATGIKIVVDKGYAFDDQYDKMILSFMAGNKEYDLQRVSPTWFPDMAPYAADLNELAKRVPDAPALQLDYYPQGVLNVNCYYEGKLIGLPIISDVTLLVWNKEYYEEVGLDPEEGPADWDEIYENGLKLMNLPDRYGFAFPAGIDIQTQVIYLLLFQAFGGEYYDKDGNPQFDSDASVKAIKFMVEKLAKIAPPDCTTYGWPEMFNAFASGRCAQSMQWNGGLGGYDDPEQSKVVGKWGVKPIPGGGCQGGFSLVVSKDSPNIEAAYLYAAWATSPEIERTLAQEGFSPSLKSVMTDPELVAKYPFYAQLEDALDNSFTYPGPFYTDFTVIMNKELNGAIAGQKTPEKAAEDIQQKVVKVLEERGVLK